MSDLPLKPTAGAGHSAPLLSIASSAPDTRYGAHGPNMTIYEGRTGPARVASDYSRSASAASMGQVPAMTGGAIFGHTLGLLLTIGAGLLAVLSDESWLSLASRIGPIMSHDWARWLVITVLGLAGISFLPCKPIAFAAIAGQAALCFYCADQLLAGFFSEKLLGRLMPGWSAQALVIASLSIAYLMLASRRAGGFNLRSTIGLILIALAALGTLKGWYNWARLEPAVGSDAARLLTLWSQECTWAVLVIVTAIGVSFSRTRTVHLLMAVLLVALAVHCVSTGMTKIHTFPELSKTSELITIDHRSYENVALWRWIVALELVCIACVLVHMASGMGALTLVCAITWMFVGLSLYDSVGRMSLTKSGFDSMLMKSFGAPGLATDNGWLPVAGQPPANQGGVTGQNAPGVLTAADHRAMQTAQRQAVVREVTPLAWMLLTAIFAGVIAVCGVRMMAQSSPAQSILRFATWILFISALVVVVYNWPREAGQPWEKWALSFRYSRQHIWGLWVIFLGSAAVVGNWALHRGSQMTSWAYAAAGCIFLGTASTLVGAALLICYGGFPQLPTWTYAMIAALQSSMAWALLIYTNFAAQSFATNRVRH
jgi:hypothetical protein